MVRKVTVRPSTIGLNARVQETGGPNGGVNSMKQAANFALNESQKYSAKVQETAYLKGQTTLTKDFTRIEQEHKNSPGRLTEALGNYTESFLDEINDPEMRARYELQITKSSASAVARATAGQKSIVDENSRFTNLQAYQGIKNKLPGIAQGLLSDDDAVAFAAGEELQETMARTAGVMSATDADGNPLFNASFRSNQLNAVKDTALSTAVIDRVTRSENPREALRQFESGQTLMRLPNPGESTVKISNRLSNDLQKALDITPAAAAGIIGSLAHETGGFMEMQELNPVVPGSRGGTGYAQWTGPRRIQFEEFAEDNGLDPSSYAANAGFLIHELKNTPEGKVLNDLKGIEDPQEATAIFSDKFLRPGIPHTESRLAWTQSLIENADNEGVDLINLRHSISTQSAKLVSATVNSHIAAQEAQATQQRNVVNSQFELAIDTAMDDVAPDPNLIGPSAPTMSKSQKLANVLDGIDNNPLFSETPEGVIKGNALRKKVFAKLKADQEKNISINAGSAFAGGSSFLNRQDPQAKKAYNDYYESIEPGLAGLDSNERNVEITGIVNNAKSVPDRLTGDIQRIARSRDIEQITMAVDLIDRIGDVNPHLIEDIAPPKDLARLRMINDRVNLGYLEDEALKIVDEILDPRNEITQGEANAQLKDKDINYRSKAMNLYDSSILPMNLGLETEGQAAAGQLDGLTGAYRVAYEDHYRITRDEGLSATHAAQFVQGRYGVTSVNGGDQVMQFPPEKYYSIQGEDSGWMREQMIKDAQGIFKNTFREDSEQFGNADLKENLRLFVIPEQTKRTAATGAPRYQMMYKTKNGTFTKVGGPYYFDPDKRRKQLVDDVAKKQAVADEHGAASIQKGLFDDRAFMQKQQKVKFNKRRDERIKGITIQLDNFGVK